LICRYCDCFANGLNCQNCACLNCHNDSRHEEERTKAVAATLERNPNAFKSKMFKFGSYETISSIYVILFSFQKSS